MTVDFDDFGASRIISDMCRSWDCREKLIELKEINPNFKVTLFTIPGETTPEICDWVFRNKDWVELAYHGFFHTSNYECEKIDYETFDNIMNNFWRGMPDLADTFVKGFKAPGWQISDDIYRWALDNGFWVSDQGYNDHRRPKELPAYINYNGTFKAKGKEIPSWHGHTWDCVGNGIYETFDRLSVVVRDADNFEFVSEVV